MNNLAKIANRFQALLAEAIPAWEFPSVEQIYEQKDFRENPEVNMDSIYKKVDSFADDTKEVAAAMASGISEESAMKTLTEKGVEPDLAYLMVQAAKMLK